MQVVDDAIKFVKESSERIRLSGEENDKESNEPDYNYEKEPLEGEQEEETGEIDQTTNQVF